MRKLIGLMLVIINLLCLVACHNQNVSFDQIHQMPSEQIYIYDEGFGGQFFIKIKNDGTFCYSEGSLSSYYGIGGWTLNGDVLCLIDDEQVGLSLINYFKINENALVFLSDSSTNFSYVNLSNGEEFRRQ